PDQLASSRVAHARPLPMATVHFTACQKQVLPNGVCLTTFLIPLTTVPAGEGSLLLHVVSPSLSFAPGSALPTAGAAAPALAAAGAGAPPGEPDSAPRSIRSSSFLVTV